MNANTEHSIDYEEQKAEKDASIRLVQHAARIGVTPPKTVLDDGAPSEELFRYVRAHDLSFDWLFPLDNEPTDLRCIRGLDPSNGFPEETSFFFTEVTGNESEFGYGKLHIALHINSGGVPEVVVRRLVQDRSGDCWLEHNDQSKEHLLKVGNPSQNSALLIGRVAYTVQPVGPTISRQLP